ncbi:MAG: diaminopimelate decarboxylase [Clostridiales Family XIII bacterium]|jgi:diaminopimelate decarboxylase|nr:diaminopimelate decarboxylase [Clostridiales Family XIII bacterium]
MEKLEINNGRLCMDGVDLADLAKEYGTPLYVMSMATLERNIAEVKKAFLGDDAMTETDCAVAEFARAEAETARAKTEVAYASKAFLCTAMAQIIERSGLSLDVVSGGELFTALRAGFPPERIIFHGSNKTPQEIEAAVLAGDVRIVVDADGEVDMIERIYEKLVSEGRLARRGADGADMPVRVLFRINPRVDIHGHEYISTGKADSKFGFSIDEDVIYPAIGRAAAAERVRPVGVHFHVGSQVFDNTAHKAAVGEALKVVKGVKDRLGVELSEVNVGGGFGIRYTDGDVRKPYSYFTDPIVGLVNEYCEANGLAVPKVIIEPGRSIVGDAGLTLYTVGSIREIAGIRKFVSVDGGMTDNIRPALYEAKYEAAIVNRAGEPVNETVTIVGKCCESGDMLIKDTRLAHAESGDILAVFTTGAYGYSMASNYNKQPIPAVVLVDGGKAQLIVRRQTYEELAARDLPLSEH